MHTYNTTYIIVFLQCVSLVLWQNPVLCLVRVSKTVEPCLTMILLYFTPTSPFSPALALSCFTTLTSNCADLPAPTVKTGWIQRTPKIRVSCALAAPQQPIRAQDSV